MFSEGGRRVWQPRVDRGPRVAGMHWNIGWLPEIVDAVGERTSSRGPKGRGEIKRRRGGEGRLSASGAAVLIVLCGSELELSLARDRRCYVL